MILQGAWQQVLSFFGEKPIVVEPVEADLSSDAGLLPIRQLDEALQLTEQFAAVLMDPRDGPALTHSYLEMTRSRVYGILAGYEDQNDHDTLRNDSIFKLVAGRSPDPDDLASQPTLSRFENAIEPSSLFRLADLFIDQFIAAFAEPPTHLTFDIDVIDDPPRTASSSSRSITATTSSISTSNAWSPVRKRSDRDGCVVVWHGAAESGGGPGLGVSGGAVASGLAGGSDQRAGRFGLRGAEVLRSVRSIGCVVQHRVRDERGAEAWQ